ncbi:MAG: hypothetical protein GWO24_07095, partial [Akkermansiaceae bacterium]|nr:hypothetical protein [Akkermansiaceae bacterium]
KISVQTPREGELFRIGSIVVTEADLSHHLRERHNSRNDEQARQDALDDLVKRARFAQAALDAGLADDPAVRDQVGRLLASRLRETELGPMLETQQEIPEERLRELYQEQIARFQAPEKRQVAALWLNPGLNPDKVAQYRERLSKAREFALQTADILDHAEKGFSVLSIDYSEHAASRFKGGMVGWMEQGGGLDPWTRAVAEIAYTLKNKGGISEVTVRPEGVFLVRLVDLKPAVTRPFEAVAPQLERAERNRLQKKLTANFEQKIEARYPVT